MQNVCARGKRGTFYVKKDIPHDVRAAFNGQAQVWRSLGTNNKLDAIAAAHPILAEIDAKIEAARARAAEPEPVKLPAPGLFRRDQLLSAIAAWRSETITRA